MIAGLFSAAIANRNHRHLKWWELRVKAYQDAIEALSDLIHCYDSSYKAEMEYSKLTPERDQQLNSLFIEAGARIRRLADTGAFLFSDSANEALNEFREKEHADMYLEHLEQCYTKAKKCLTLLVLCSKADLELRGSWLTRWI